MRSSWGLMLANASSLDARDAITAVIVAVVLAVVVAVLCQVAGVAQGPALAAVTFLLVAVVLLLL